MALSSYGRLIACSFSFSKTKLSMSNGRIFWNETPPNATENLALCFFSSKGNKPGKIILNGFFVLDCCQAEWRAKWCSPYMHVPVEVHECCINALKKGSTQSPGEDSPDTQLQLALPACCLPAQVGTTGHWVPWHLCCDWHLMGITQDQRQSCSLAATPRHTVPRKW